MWTEGEKVQGSQDISQVSISTDGSKQKDIQIFECSRSNRSQCHQNPSTVTFVNLDFQNDISRGQSLAMNSSFDVFSAVKNTSRISRAGNKCLSHYTRKEYFCPKVALLLSLSALFSLSTDFFEKNSVHVHINVVDNVGIGFFVGLSPQQRWKVPEIQKNTRMQPSQCIEEPCAKTK